jgi:hypothetical protein
MIRTFIVTSKDGIQFSVQIYARSGSQAAIAEQHELRYAATLTADQLAKHGDFHRVGAAAPVVDPPPALPQRPVLRLIQGGLSDREYDTVESLVADPEIVLI